MKFFLVGFMGSGKTNIGKRLATLLGYSFIDLDQLLEERLNTTVSEYFEREGEAAFRTKENELLNEIANSSEAVILSTGGGAPCFFDAMETMNSHGCTIYIQVTPEGLYNRLKHASKSRPLLKGRAEKDLQSYIQQLLQKREQFYKQAQLTIDGESTNADRLANQLSQLGLIK